MKKSLFMLAILTIVVNVILIGCEKKETQDGNIVEGKRWEARQLENKDFLKTDGTKVKNNFGKGDTVILRGANAGGWLVQEIWMCPTRQSEEIDCQIQIINTLTERFGKQKADELIKIYEQNYWTENDFENCNELGMNVLRLPISYMNLLDENNKLRDDAFEKIDWFVEEAGKRGIYVIIDMHGAPGSQSGAHHSGDTTQGAGLFYGENKAENQELYVYLWSEIAKHYNGNPVVAGYDLLNEPYCDMDENTGKTCWDLYDRAYDAIRENDAEHIIIMEAKWDPQNLPDPKDYNWENVMYEYHSYNYDDQNDEQAQFESIELKLDLADYADYGVPNYIGETSFFGNTKSWEMCLNEMNRRSVHWTTWTYKVTGGGDNMWGIYNLLSDDADLHKDSYEEIKEKWSNIGETIPNSRVVNILKKYYTGYYEKNIK